MISSGISVNTVPDFCNFKFDFRPINQDVLNLMFEKLKDYLIDKQKTKKRKMDM